MSGVQHFQVVQVPESEPMQHSHDVRALKTLAAITLGLAAAASPIIAESRQMAAREPADWLSEREAIRRAAVVDQIHLPHFHFLKVKSDKC